MQRVKLGKKKNDQADLKWRHSPEAMEKGKVTYACKFFGSAPVSKPKGSELIKEAIKKLQFANDIKKSEEGLKASKLKKVELCVSVQSLVLTETKSKADELTLAVGQAFDLAYKKFKANQAAGKKEVDQMKQRVQSTEKENELLKKKLEELERSQAEDSVAKNDKFQPTVTTSEQATTDPFSASATLAFDSKNPSNHNPFALPTDPGAVEAFPTSNSSNPFAATPQEQPATNQGDLLNIFTSANSPDASQEEDLFDPLSKTNGMPSAQGSTRQELPNFRPLDEATAKQSETSTSLSRPKSSAISGGLLPPPPTKQSIKAAQKVQPANETSVNPHAEYDASTEQNLSLNHQEIKDVQDGFENNLVLF